jgi:hypothetical protein
MTSVWGAEGICFEFWRRRLLPVKIGEASMAVGLLFSTNFSGSIHLSEDLRGPGRDDKPFFCITSLTTTLRARSD